VSNGSRPTKPPDSATGLLSEAFVQEEASALAVAGLQAAVTVYLLQTMASVCKKACLVWSSCTHGGFVGVDNVLEITIITADGDHVIANPYRNKDLFWALRGGGGGTWGVVTSVTYKTHPSTSFSSASLLVNFTNADSIQNLLTEIIRLTPSLVEQGYGGYAFGTTEQITFFVMSPNVTAEQTQATFSPLFEFAISQPGFSVENDTILYQDFWQAYDLLSISGPVGTPVELSSWLLPKDVIETDQPEELAGELLKLSNFAYSSVVFFFFTIPGNENGS